MTVKEFQSVIELNKDLKEIKETCGDWCKIRDYDKNGNLILFKSFSLTDKKNIEDWRAYEYDKNNRLVCFNNLDTRIIERYKYNENGNLIYKDYKSPNKSIQYAYIYNNNNLLSKVIDIDDNKIIELYAYDKTNRLSLKSIDGEKFSYSYFENYYIEYCTCDDLKSNNIYDLNGNILVYDTTEGLIYHIYDSNNNIVKEITDDGEIIYEAKYDNQNRLIYERDNIGLITEFKYNDEGFKIQKIEIGNNIKVITNYKYIKEY